MDTRFDAELIRRYSTQPAVDLRHLVRWVFFNLYVGNTDSHAKNLSIYSVPGQGVKLTPFYDLMCTRLYPGLSPEFAFAIVQGADVVSIEVPALDAGWSPSKPEKRKFIWKGLIGGIQRVKVIDKTLSNGTVRLQVKGKAVPGAALLDVLSPYEIQTYFDTACNRTTH